MRRTSLLITCLLLLCSVSFAQAVTNKPPSGTSPLHDPKPVAFRITQAGTKVSMPVNAHSVNGQMLILETEEFDLGNDVSESVFTAPENGIYHFDARVNLVYPGPDQVKFERFLLLLNKNWQPLEKTELTNLPAGERPATTMALSTTVLLKKGDKVALYFRADASSGSKELTATAISFSGFQVSAVSGGQ
jgi:hypothetical protein